MNRTLSSLTMTIGLCFLFLTAAVFAAPPQPESSNVKLQQQDMKVKPTQQNKQVKPVQQNHQITPLGVLTVTMPKNGDYWTIGYSEGVYWNYTAAAGKNVNIWLVKGTASIHKIVGNLDIANTVHHWVVPESIVPGTDYRVMIESVEHPAFKSYSTGFFTIRKIPTEIKVMMPNGGQSWTRGTTQNIGWIYTHNPGKTVKIILTKDGGQERVISSSYDIHQQIEHMGLFVWQVPNDLTPGSNYKIRIQVNNTQYMDASDQPFTIQ